MNLTPPALGPQFPVYPELPQIVRPKTKVPPILPKAGGVIYEAITQQYAGNLTFRDREDCYLMEPNGVELGAGLYDCRLVGNYLGLPLYATTCCVVGPLPSLASLSSEYSSISSFLSSSSVSLSSSPSPSSSSLLSSSSTSPSSSRPSSSSSSSAVAVDGLTLEDDSGFLLLEDGDPLLLE